MKSFLSFFSAIFFFLSTLSFGQCPGCVIDYNCTISPAKPILCPDTLPSGVAMQYYDEDLTFYMPAQFIDAGSGFNVTLNRIEVIGVVGLPHGLSFESSSPTNNFYPSSNPPLTEHACVKFCGTPLLAGNYIITVNVKAYVTVLGMNQTQYDFFDIPITILPATSGNNSFIMSNAAGCVPLTTTFTPIHQSHGNQHFSYFWDFGNGQTSTAEFPSTQIYDQAGSYPVSLSTTIDTLGYFLSSVTINGNSSMCSDLFGGLPDYFIKILRGSNVIYQSAEVTNQLNVTFTFPTIKLLDSLYSVEVWDNDDIFGGGATGDDFCGTIAFNGHTAGNHSYNINNMTITFTVNNPILNFYDTDTVHVYPPPIFGGFITLPSDSVCYGDTIVLSASGTNNIQWYKDGLAIAGETQNELTVTDNGQFHAILANQFGCTLSSDSIQLVFVENPPLPTFWQSGNVIQTMISGYNLQWFLEGSPINGATGQSITISQSGFYSLQASNDFGCSTMSNDYFASYTFIEEIENSLFSKLMIYPNPTIDLINIQFETTASGDINIQIFDLLGSLMLSQRATFIPGNVHLIQNVSTLAPGLYVLSLKTEKGTLHFKILVQ